MEGDDFIDGGTGVDTMIGGFGNDVFVVDNYGDKVYEAAGQGMDTIYTPIGFTIAAGQAIEVLGTDPTSTAAVNLYGNEFGQTILGNNGANLLSSGGGNDVVNGMAGNDLIYGGAGNDTLTGGAGYDSFIFDTWISATTNVDQITDFNPADDSIALDNAVMPGLGNAQALWLPSTSFWKSTTGLAHDSDDRIYDTDTGKLFYDSNGDAEGGSTHIATLAPNLALTAADFLVI